MWGLSHHIISVPALGTDVLEQVSQGWGRGLHVRSCWVGPHHKAQRGRGIRDMLRSWECGQDFRAEKGGGGTQSPEKEMVRQT